MATGTGILLNNELDDFSAKPGVPNAYGLIGGEANAVAPRKRPLSSMSPTLVFRDGKFVLATGYGASDDIIEAYPGVPILKKPYTIEHIAEALATLF